MQGDIAGLSDALPLESYCPMQNQRTEPLPADELDVLSVEEEKLVEAVALGHDNPTAYQMAYGATGYSPGALKVRACRKIAEPKIQAHLRALRAVGLANSGLTIQRRIETELAFAERAEMAGNFGAAGGAHDRVNKLLGMYVEKIKDVTNDTDPVRTLRDIAAIAGEDVAASLANKHGIEWAKPEGERVH